MKKLITCLSILACILPGAWGQRLSSLDTNKYRINLPDYWKPGNKVWQILVDKLPHVCDELKDKELCGDNCNPRYFIEFEMSPPAVFSHSYNHISADYTNTVYKKPTDSWDFNTHYSFECYLLLFDEKDKLLTKFIVVDSMEEWTVTHRVTLAAYAPPPTQMLPVRRNWASRNASSISSTDYALSNQANFPAVGQEGQTPFSYINANSDRLWPTNKDLFLVVDRKFNSW
ncbi:MAG: hypothetical protein ABIR30_08870 [Chitinophagaceae bacterium]